MRRAIQAKQHSKYISIKLLFSTDQRHIHTPVCLQQKPTCYDKTAILLFGVIELNTSLGFDGNCTGLPWVQIQPHCQHTHGH